MGVSQVRETSIIKPKYDLILVTNPKHTIILVTRF